MVFLFYILKLSSIESLTTNFYSAEEWVFLFVGLCCDRMLNSGTSWEHPRNTEGFNE